MLKQTRRQILTSVAFIAASPIAFAQDMQIDVAKLNEPSAIGEMVIGADTAKVTVIEYASATCPHCRDFYTKIFVNLKKDYIDSGKVKFIFREFPHNDPALAAFMVARCAPKEKFFPLVDVFFETQDKWTQNPLEGLKNIAQQAGMTEAQFNDCLKNEKVAKDILAVREKAEASFGVKGIPTIFINGVRYKASPEDYAEFKKAIDPLLG